MVNGKNSREMIGKSNMEISAEESRAELSIASYNMKASSINSSMRSMYSSQTDSARLEESDCSDSDDL